MTTKLLPILITFFQQVHSDFSDCELVSKFITRDHGTLLVTHYKGYESDLSKTEPFWTVQEINYKTRFACIKVPFEVCGFIFEAQNHKYTAQEIAEVLKKSIEIEELIIGNRG